MKKLAFLLIIMLCLFVGQGFAGEKKVLRMATTTSTDNTGLLDYLAPMFKKDTGIELQWIAVGTGKALRLGQNCDVDILLVHAPPAEKKFVAAGYGINRREVMYNDFVIVGPPEDPAGIKGLSVKKALKKIAAKKATFVSRGDDSGTNKKELALWKMAGIDPKKLDKEPWYIQTGQGMLATLNVAAEKKGYTLTDRGTYIKLEYNHKGNPPLVILVEGDKALRNQYSVIEINPKRCPNVKNDLARAFSDWITSPKAQKAIAEFKLLGKQLFIPNAKPACTKEFGKGENVLRVATGSPGVLGLLDALTKDFCEKNNCRVCWLKRGSGGALQELKAGNVDLVIVHSPAAEKQAIKEGYAVKRTLIGGNEFVIVGPKNDPAKVKEATGAADAFKRIYKAGAKFISRGDNSGTHKREMLIWQLAGLTPKGEWYIISNNFMTPSLLMADRERAYFMSDSSTYYVNKGKLNNIVLLYKGDPVMVNPYHALLANPKVHTHANYDLAENFLAYLISEEGQKIMREFGKDKYGIKLYLDRNEVLGICNPSKQCQKFL